MLEDVRGVMVMIVGNGYGDPSSNPRRDCLDFRCLEYHWEMYETKYSSSSNGQIVGQTGYFILVW